MKNTYESLSRKRIVRVFLSSTFKDMQQERDDLARYTYPRLRAFCRERQVDFVEVDLRWGITSEQSENDETLDICLDEIDHCRPYFIGLLGERYGWVPNQLPRVVMSKHPWLTGQKGASITQMEIYYGVLNDPSLTNHGFFYLRSPNYVQGIPDQDRHKFLPENIRAKRKLQSLKTKIRNCGLPVLEDYDNPVALAEKIYADLCEAINTDYPMDHVPDSLETEKNGHMEYAFDRARVYMNREADFARLHLFADDVGSVPLLITGESGVGKSALLANWAIQYMHQRPDDFVFLHFIGSTPQSTNNNAILRRLMNELKVKFAIEQEIPDSLEELQRALPNFLFMAAQSGQRIVLIFDGLNQLADCGNSQCLSWLPDTFPNTVRVFISILPGKSMEIMTSREYEELIVLPLTTAEQSTLIDVYLAHYSKKMSGRQKNLVLNSQLSWNPLYLVTILDEIRRLGEYDQLEDRIRNYLEAEDIPSLYKKVLERMDFDYARNSPELVRETMSLIGCARLGLSESELLELLGNPPKIVWSPLYAVLRELTVIHSGIICFSNDYLRQAVFMRYLEDKDVLMGMRKRLINYFEQKPLESRKIDELPWLLSQMEQWKQLYKLLCQSDLFLLLWQKDQYEAKNYWAQIEAHSSLRKTAAYRPVVEKFEKHGNDIAFCITVLLMDTGNGEEAEMLLHRLISRCESSDDSFGEQRALGYLGILMFSRGDLEGAAAFFHRKEDICRKREYYADLHSALGNQGLILFRNGELNGAMDRYQESEQICHRLNFHDGMQIALGNQGNVLYASGEPDSALTKYIEQEKICRRMGNLSGLKVSLGCQGVIYYGKGELEKAMNLYKKQENICRSLGDKEGLQVCLGNQGGILFAQEDYKGAYELQKKKVALCKQLSNQQGQVIALGNLGLISEKQKNERQALVHYVEQEKMCRRLQDMSGIAHSLFKQAQMLLKLQRTSESHAKSQEAMAISQQNDLTPLAIQIGEMFSALWKSSLGE